MKLNFHWNLSLKRKRPSVNLITFFSDKINYIESTLEENVKNLDNNIRSGEDLKQSVNEYGKF